MSGYLRAANPSKFLKYIPQMPLPSGLSNEKKDILARIAFSKTVILKLFYAFGQQPAVASRYKVT